MARFSITLFVLAVFTVGAVFLQIFLSKRESKWPGLILPMITLAFSFMAVLGIAVFTASTTTQQSILENGEVVNEIVEGSPKEPIADTASLIFAITVTFLLYNIPTAVLLAIYAACRGKRKRNLALEKMSVQDLE